MKDAVAMDISIYGPHGRRSFAVSIYHPNKKSIGARKERLCLSAISMSSEQSQTATMSDSVRFGIEPYATLYTHGERRQFLFEADAHKTTDSSVKAFATDLGLAILRNAHLVEFLQVNVAMESRFVKTFFSLGAWKEAFPSLRSAYLLVPGWCRWQFDLSPHLLKHVRGLELTGTVQPAVLPYIERMIRNKDNGIEAYHPRALRALATNNGI